MVLGAKDFLLYHCKKLYMRKVLIIAAVMAIPFSIMAQAKSKGKKMKFKDFNEQLSYVLGLNIAENFDKQGFKLDPEILKKGLADYFAGNKNLNFNDGQIDSIFTEYNKRAQEYETQKTAAEKEKYVTEGKKFLEQNAKNDSVVVLPSGLQYKMIRSGNGVKPVASDQVKVNYKGTLLDGTQFDSSYDRNEPVTFGLGQVIKGWTEGLQLMDEGSKYMLYIPAELAYGDRSAGPFIKPGMTLIFQVELLNVVK